MTPRSVLVIDGGSETGAVLQAVLEPRGATVHRTRAHRQTTTLQNGEHPDVVVIDLDESDAHTVWRATPRVLLSSDRLFAPDAQTRFLEKPFHYPELVRAIEDLLTQNA